MVQILPAHKVLQVTVGPVEEGKAGHGEGAAKGEEKAELPGLQNDDRQIHHGEAETDEAETEGEQEADEPLPLGQGGQTLCTPRLSVIRGNRYRVEISRFLVETI